MPRVLIAGCGYVGQAAARLFLGHGWEVEGWTRSSSAEQLPFPVRAVDVSDPEQVNANAGEFDGVIQATSTGGGDVDVYRRVYLTGAHNLCRVFPKAKIVFTSSTGVYGQTDGQWVTEESETKPQRETGRILLEAERVVLEHGGVVLRFGGIYGPGRSALLDKFVGSNGEIDPATDRYVNSLHRDDAAKACLMLLGQSGASSRGDLSGIYNAVDNEPLLLSECFRWLRETVRRQERPGASATFSGRRGRTNKRVSNARLRAAGWEPRYPTFYDGMRQSVLPASGLPIG